MIRVVRQNTSEREIDDSRFGEQNFPQFSESKIRKGLFEMGLTYKFQYANMED